MTAQTWQPLLGRVLAVCIPLLFGLSVPLTSPKAPFHRASRASYAALGLALITAALAVVPTVGEPLPTALEAMSAGLARLVRLDVVTYVMLALVCFIATVIVRYSRTYLHGDAGQLRYARALLATLASVTVLVVTNHLLVLSLAWVGTSLALHRLLTFYRDRPQALVAAHKKFLVSRLGDACMLGAVALIGMTVGSLELDAVNAWARESASMPLRMQLAAVLLVLAASLKSAQLPFHGWLLQVMEAPTPVSALLHAGVVNIGGFLMIRLAPFMVHVPVAQALLVIIGTVTAVVASLVMTTRVSVKVALAWSTCAQMGFMLIECGLGAFHLALLHLVAHSLYKAHAFLSSGSAVDVWRAHASGRPRPPVTLARVLVATGLVLASITAVAVAGHSLAAAAGVASPPFTPLTAVFALSLVPLVMRSGDGGLRARVGLVLKGAGITALYFGGHALAARVLPSAEPATAPLVWLIPIVGFVLLFGVQVVLECRPGGALARHLQPRLFAGLYLDELFTRTTFWLWPPRLPGHDAQAPTLRIAKTLEAP